MLNSNRLRRLNDRLEQTGFVVDWMHRDQRLKDHWALLVAAEYARKMGQEVHIVFCLVPEFLEATIRQYGFMLRGLEEVEEECRKRGIPFHLLLGDPTEQLPRFLKKIKAGLLVRDFSPLRISRIWADRVAQTIDIPFLEVDAHNIVPCWVATPKEEFGAHTLRPKINRLLPTYLEEFPALHLPSVKDLPPAIDWKAVWKSLRVNTTIEVVNWIQPGEKAAAKALKEFIEERLPGYAERRNDPTLDGQSGLSPYLHFGHLSPQRIALAVKESTAPKHDREAFLEELIIRRELSDNFCFYQKNYDKVEGFTNWAKTTIDLHRKDPREFVYSLHEFEQAKTHDELWNAAQRELTQTGKMHGYMRMYWAKKILEWTKSPEDAMKIAIFLNDRYELDGRDPNGYVGVAWSIGGIHDRAWGERDVFGKIRYMNASGCKRKFDVEAYIRMHS